MNQINVGSFNIPYFVESHMVSRSSITAFERDQQFQIKPNCIENFIYFLKSMAMELINRIWEICEEIYVHFIIVIRIVSHLNVLSICVPAGADS